MSELREELEKRGSAEIVNGKVCQVTQALDETKDTVKYLSFGELKEQGYIPIEEACQQCEFGNGKFENVKACQESQAEDARARGFHKIICPKQFQES